MGIHVTNPYSHAGAALPLTVNAVNPLPSNLTPSINSRLSKCVYVLPLCLANLSHTHTHTIADTLLVGRGRDGEGGREGVYI